MSQSHTSSYSSSSNVESIFRASFDAYKKRTGRDITSHPLAIWLKTCDSPDAVRDVLRAQVEDFGESRKNDEGLTKWLNPTIDVLYAFSATLSEGPGLVSSHATVIFAGIGVLLLASKVVASGHRTLINIFERIENFFKRLEAYTEVPQTAAMTDIIARIMVEVLSISAIATKEIKQGRTKKYFKKIARRRDLDDALERLDKLTQEARMAIAEVPQLAENVDDNARPIVDEPEATNDLQAETPHDASGGTPASEEPGRLAHACYAFDGKGEGELPLVVGQELEILDDLDLLWWYVRDVHTGNGGVVPASYVL